MIFSSVTSLTLKRKSEIWKTGPEIKKWKKYKIWANLLNKKSKWLNKVKRFSTEKIRNFFVLFKTQKGKSVNFNLKDTMSQTVWEKTTAQWVNNLINWTFWFLSSKARLLKRTTCLAVPWTITSNSLSHWDNR